MIKSILIALALMGSAAASAETVTLGPDACGIVKQCISIPNDTGLELHLYGAPGYPFFYVYVDGVPYKSTIASGYGGDNVVLADTTGDVIYLTYSFTTYRTCSRSGRGQTCSTHWSLTGGTLVR